jgi:plasmid stabilization system protein ParE
LRVTRRAATQIERALDTIEAESPQGANRMRERIQTLFLLLAQHPHAGQATDLPGVRRLSVSLLSLSDLLPRRRRRGYRSAHAPHIAPAALRVRRAMMVLGYARVPTDGQSVDAQVKALRAAGAEKVWRETAGAKTDRTRFWPRGSTARHDQGSRRPLALATLGPTSPRHAGG